MKLVKVYDLRAERIRAQFSAPLSGRNSRQLTRLCPQETVAINHAVSLDQEKASEFRESRF